MEKTVLILEDSRTQAMVIAKMFERAGFQAVVAFDNEAAFIEIRLRKLDLLVLDVFVETTNSLEHLEEYRRRAPGVPIAIMTAGQADDPAAGPDALNRARRLGVDFLLPKPFRFEDVNQVCEEVGARASLADAS